MREIYESRILNTPKINIPFHVYSNKTAVICDPRWNDLMIKCIHLFMSYLSLHGWNLMIISASQHEQDILNEFPTAYFIAIPNHLLNPTNPTKPNMTIESYNLLLLSIDFWKQIPTEHVLIFQTDCYIYKMFENKWLEYDFVGASYWTKEDISPRLGGINGGLSLRKKSAMIDCLKKISWSQISSKNKNEDVFFTFACDLLNKKCPTVDERKYFAIEAERWKDTCFYHGWNKNYHDAAFMVLEK